MDSVLARVPEWLAVRCACSATLRCLYKANIIVLSHYLFYAWNEIRFERDFAERQRQHAKNKNELVKKALRIDLVSTSPDGFETQTSLESDIESEVALAIWSAVSTPCSSTGDGYQSWPRSSASGVDDLVIVPRRQPTVVKWSLTEQDPLHAEEGEKAAVNSRWSYFSSAPTSSSASTRSSCISRSSSFTSASDALTRPVSPSKFSSADVYSGLFRFPRNPTMVGNIIEFDSLIVKVQQPATIVGNNYEQIESSDAKQLVTSNSCITDGTSFSIKRKPVPPPKNTSDDFCSTFCKGNLHLCGTREDRENTLIVQRTIASPSSPPRDIFAGHSLFPNAVKDAHTQTSKKSKRWPDSFGIDRYRISTSFDRAARIQHIIRTSGDFLEISARYFICNRKLPDAVFPGHLDITYAELLAVKHERCYLVHHRFVAGNVLPRPKQATGNALKGPLRELRAIARHPRRHLELQAHRCRFEASQMPWKRGLGVFRIELPSPAQTDPGSVKMPTCTEHTEFPLYHDHSNKRPLKRRRPWRAPREMPRLIGDENNRYWPATRAFRVTPPDHAIAPGCHGGNHGMQLVRNLDHPRWRRRKSGNLQEIQHETHRHMPVHGAKTKADFTTDVPWIPDPRLYINNEEPHKQDPGVRDDELVGPRQPQPALQFRAAVSSAERSRLTRIVNCEAAPEDEQVITSLSSRGAVSRSADSSSLPDSRSSRTSASPNAGRTWTL